MTIGTHGPMTVEQARTKARGIIAEAKAGQDPSAEHSRMRKSPTMKELGQRFLDEYVPTHCRPTTEREYRRSVEFIVTDLSRPAERVTKFSNGRGAAEQHIKEGKHAINWTRLSCHGFRNNEVRLQLHALAYNLGNFSELWPCPRPWNTGP